MANMRDIIDDSTPEKKKITWKAKPRRSLGIASSDEWNRYIDAFDIPEQQNTKGKWTKKQIRNVTATNNNSKPKNPESHSQVDISDYSSSDDGFDDIKPLANASPPPKHHLPSHRQVLVQRSEKKKACLKRRSDVLHNGSECEVDITESSPMKPAKVMKLNERDAKIDSDSPVGKGRSVRPAPLPSTSSASQEISDYESQTRSLESMQSAKEISDYESQTRSLESMQSAKTSEATCESPLISTSSTPSDGESKVVKVRSSEWLQNLQWMPDGQTKQSGDDGDGSLEDSAKKKKQKYCKGGLADRLHNIIRRKKSTQNVWNHRQSTGQLPATDLGKSLLVELLHTKTDFSTFVTKCRVYKATKDGPPESDAKQENLTVLFSLETAKHLSLKTKSIIQIHPPWQSLQSTGSEKVILCTHFCRLLSGPRDVPDDLVTSPAHEAEPGCETLAKWSCPCLADGTFPRKSCPAQMIPCDTRPMIPQTLEIVRLTSDSPAGSPRSHLQTEILSQPNSQASRGILESIENQGGFGTCGIGLQAMVQRVFYKRIALSSERGIRPFGSASYPSATGMRVSVLLQDSMGTCCEVSLPARCEGSDGWRSLCERGEGKVWSFSGLRQHCRTNKNRDPCLFHLIESVHPAEGVALPATSSQTDSEQSQTQHVSHSAQAFCYRLVAPAGESACRLVGPGPVYRPSTLSRLSDVDRDGQLKPRVSLMCKIIYTHPQVMTGVKSPQYWYVVDDSLQSESAGSSCGYHGYRRINIQPTCWMSPALCEELKDARPTVLLKDVAVEKGQYFCDGFSRLYPASEVENNKPHLLLPSAPPTTSGLRSAVPLIGDLCEVTSVTVDDLVMMTGTVSGVNEETALTWEACDQCGSADLKASLSHGNVLSCANCERPVGTPVTCINLEVYVRLQIILQSSPVNLRIKLLQTSIEGLLPSECDEEGYDIQSVLGRPLGPLVGLVSAVVRTTGTTKGASKAVKEIQLQEIRLKQ